MENKTVNTSLNQPERKNKGLSILMVVVVLAVLGGITYAVFRTQSTDNAGTYEPVNRVSAEEMELFLRDLNNPMMLQQLSSNPEAKKKLAENLEQLFMIANQAKKEGLTNDENVKRELYNTRVETLALNYDRLINKDKGPSPPMGFITEEQINQFWEGGGEQGFWDKIGFGDNSASSREREFEDFLSAKVALAKESGAITADRQLSEEEKKQAREYFAKTRIYADEAESKRGELGEEFWKKYELQTKLQQAQFLAQLYSTTRLTKRLGVTDEEVEQYIAQHPEIDNAPQQRAKAEEILQRAKSGEDFAQLAKEFSEDPGSKDKGGLYEGVTQGAFVPEFENAALALEPGQIAPGLVESKFGYHIIKLEKKGEAKNPDGEMKPTFDARHILIGTGVKNPENPAAPAVPVREFVKQKLTKEKEERVMEEIKANNQVEVAQDFKIPEVSPEQLNKMMQNQMPMSPPVAPEEDRPTGNNPAQGETKKK